MATACSPRTEPSVSGGKRGEAIFLPISNVDRVTLDDLLGYELQKRELRRNTEAFLAGKTANNVLLYGDAGTGKIYQCQGVNQ